MDKGSYLVFAQEFAQGSKKLSVSRTEVGSGWVQGLTDPAAAHEVFLTRITRVEIVAAITRRSRGGPVPATAAPALLAQFRHDAAHQ